MEAFIFQHFSDYTSETREKNIYLYQEKYFQKRSELKTFI